MASVSKVATSLQYAGKPSREWRQGQNDQKCRLREQVCLFRSLSLLPGSMSTHTAYFSSIPIAVAEHDIERCERRIWPEAVMESEAQDSITDSSHSALRHKVHSEFQPQYQVIWIPAQVKPGGWPLQRAFEVVLRLL